jgi:hypothetical protein
MAMVERTVDWLNQFRRLRVRYEKQADIHECFLALERALIWWRSGESIERRVEDRFARNRLTGPHLQPTIVSL